MKGGNKLRTCRKGHTFYKKSDCLVCPVYEEERKPVDSFLSLLAAPARRALEREKIETLHDLSKCSEKNIMALHGMGKITLVKLHAMLKKEGLTFKP